MYKYRVIGLILLLVVFIVDYLSFDKLLTAFRTYDYYSIGFTFLIYLYPIEMILLNDVPFLFRSREEVIERRWRLLVDGKPFYKSVIIEYTDYAIIFFIIISFLIMAIGGFGNYLMTHFFS